MVQTNNPEELKPLLGLTEPEGIARAFFQGHMGQAWRSDKAALVQVGDFSRLYGQPDIQLLEPLCSRGRMTLVEAGPQWDALLSPVASRRTRYAMALPPQFDRERLQQGTELPGFCLREIDGELYGQLMKEPWSEDLCGNFEDCRDFLKRGLGVAALENGRPVAGAASFTLYDDGIEIEIDTREDYRRKGLARACGSALILRCLDLGLVPYWDAANLASVHLAEKLGYRLKGPYDIWRISIDEMPLSRQ